MAEISAVVFDIGNVLIEWVPERYFDEACLLYTSPSPRD